MEAHPRSRVVYRDEAVALYTGDAAETLAALPGRSVNCAMTSPPYWGLRDYGTGRWSGGDPRCDHSIRRRRNARQTTHPTLGDPDSERPVRCASCGAVREDRQHGLEPTPSAYVESLRTVFGQLWRILTDDGTVWLNLGDCYSSNSGGAPTSGTATTGGRTRHRRPRAQDIVPPKNLLGMPWRVAFALQGDGWILRNAIVWHKPNAIPESVGDRLSATYEMLFLLVKQRRYYFDLDAIRRPSSRPGDSSDPRSGGGLRHDRTHPRGKNPGDVWSIATRPLKAAHFAAYPVDLPLRCIAAGCPPDGVVLDPYSGAGTTGLAARRLGRTYVGIDLNPAYHDIALDRLGLIRAGEEHAVRGKTAA